MRTIGLESRLDKDLYLIIEPIGESYRIRDRVRLTLTGELGLDDGETIDIQLEKHAGDDTLSVVVFTSEDTVVTEEGRVLRPLPQGP